MELSNKKKTIIWFVSFGIAALIAGLVFHHIPSAVGIALGSVIAYGLAPDLGEDMGVGN